MNTLIHPARSTRLLLLLSAAILLPRSVGAQQLSVSPTSVSVQANVGSNAPSKTVQVKKRGKPTTQVPWTVVQTSPNWVSVSPTSGVNDGTLTLAFATSALAAGTHQTSFRVDTSGSSFTVTVQATIVSSAPQLTLTCPANLTVPSLDGSPVVVTYNANTSGGVAPVNVTGVPASGSSFVVGPTSVTVTASSSDGQTKSCTFLITVEPPLTVTCPADISVASSNGSPVVVTYSAIASGGIAPRTLTYSPVSGTSFSVGTTTPVQVTAQSNDGQTKSCGFSVTVTNSSPPSTGVGPQSTITCPAGAIDIWPGTSIQSMINTYAGTTTFCLRAGVHYLTRSIVPKTGNTFVGEYGAALDGTGWTTTDGTESAFRAYNQDIDYVTIRNLVIRNMSQGGIHAFHMNSDHWTIEYNEITSNAGSVGIVFPSYTLIRNNYIHHNSYGGFLGAYAHFSIVENNEISYNGREQKMGESANATVRNNFFHHNVGNGIWYDGSNTNALIEGNVVEDNGGSGIHYEISSAGTIQNNIIRRSGEIGVFISTSQNVQVHHNTLENNFRSILYFVSCYALSIGFDLKDVAAHDNTITIGTQNGVIANGLSYTGNCTSAQLAPYLNVSDPGWKNLTFSSNTYHLPSLAAPIWLWNVYLDWNQWRAIPQDATSTAGQ